MFIDITIKPIILAKNHKELLCRIHGKTAINFFPTLHDVKG